MKRSILTYVLVVVAGALLAVPGVLVLYGLPVVEGGWQVYAGLLVLMALIAVAEGAAIQFSAGRAVLSAASIPIVALVPLFGPSVAVAATAVSEATGFFVLRKGERIKALFNTAQFTLAIALGSIVYMALGGNVLPEQLELRTTVLPLGGLILVYFFTNTTLVSIVLALDTGTPLRETWSKVGPVSFANDLASSLFSLLLVFAFAELQLAGLMVLIVPLFFVHHSYAMYLQLQKQNKEILELLIRTIEAKDPYTSGHSQRVASLSRQLAEALGLSGRKAEEVETAALLHDIGKIDIAYNELISSPARLTEAEREIIRSHPERGARLLASISSLGGAVIEAVRHHHEHYDGNGYPDGLAGRDIPLAARIIMVVDTVDAMLSDRPYRPALTPEDVAAELRRFSARQFDPVVAEKLLEVGLLHKAARRSAAERVSLPTQRVFPRRQIAAPFSTQGTL